MAYAEDWVQTVIKKTVNTNGTTKLKGPSNINFSYNRSSSSSSSTVSVKKDNHNKNTNKLSKNEYNNLDSNEDVNKPLMFSSQLGSKIASARTKLGLDRKTLASNLSITESDLAKVETGKSKFDQGLLTKINRQLGTSFKKEDL
jgi:ribosome-binding protein aMBF1 (putative translation factor)